MPTPTGLPKPGEIWKRTFRLPGYGGDKNWYTHEIKFKVLERGRGDYWSLRVEILEVKSGDPGDDPGMPRDRRQLWVDPANWFRLGQLTFVEMS